jgi:hypothetical protein
VRELLELSRQPFAYLTRATLDLAPVTGLDLQPFGKSTLETAQRGGIGILDRCADELFEQPQGIVQAKLRDVSHG